jgi:outer membrane lipoprotein-sorting protein
VYLLIRPIVLCSLLGLLAAPPVEKRPLKSVEADIVAKRKTLKSLTAKVKSVTDMSTADYEHHAVSEGTHEYAVKDGKTLSRVEMTVHATTTANGNVDLTDGKTLTVSDGQMTYLLSEHNGHRTALKTKPQTESLANPLSALRGMYDLALLPDESIDGKDAYVIECTPNASQSSLQGRLVNYYLKSNGLLVKSTAYNGGGDLINTTTYTDLKTNVAIKPDRFEFKVPDGVELLDYTNR